MTDTLRESFEAAMIKEGLSIYMDVSLGGYESYETQTRWLLVKAMQPTGDDARDAARYRWIRNVCPNNDCSLIAVSFTHPYIKRDALGHEIDDLIDAAIEGSKL